MGQVQSVVRQERTSSTWRQTGVKVAERGRELEPCEAAVFVLAESIYAL